MCSNFVRMDITFILLFHAESFTSFPLERARSITSMDCCESLYSAIFPPILAGVAGFEPTIRGSKPRALPLGYTPVWSWWTDLNPRPVEYKSTALPTELHQHGAPERCRTSNLRTTKAVRYRLRYWCCLLLPKKIQPGKPCGSMDSGFCTTCIFVFLRFFQAISEPPY